MPVWPTAFVELFWLPSLNELSIIFIIDLEMSILLLVQLYFIFILRRTESWGWFLRIYRLIKMNVIFGRGYDIESLSNID